MKEYIKKAKRGGVGGPGNLLARAPKVKAMEMIAATNMPNQFKLSKNNSVVNTQYHDNRVVPSAKAAYISNRISTLEQGVLSQKQLLQPASGMRKSASREKLP